MPLTNGNDTNTPTYEPGKDNGYDDNDVDDDHDIVTTPGSDTEEPMLELPLSNWRACQCNAAKNLTESTAEEEKAAWDQYLMPARKQFDNFEDSHGYYRVLGCRKLSSDKEVDTSLKREKNIF